MKFQFNPRRSDATLAISVSGETAIINGVSYDLSPLTEGQSISFGGGSAKRDNGITVSIPLPYPKSPSIDPMQVYEVEAVDGVVNVPGHDAEQPTEIVAGVIDWPDLSPIVPQSVTMRQARIALHEVGKLSDVATAIAALPEPQKTLATIGWECSQEVYRKGELVQLLAPALGLTEADLDDLFILAASK